METFKTSVVEYARLETAIKESNVHLKALREKRQGLTDGIIAFMVSNNIDCCNLPDESRLVLKDQVQIAPINKEYITDTLGDFFKKPLPAEREKMVEETTKVLLESRDSKKTPVLRIQKKK